MLTARFSHNNSGRGSRLKGQEPIWLNSILWTGLQQGAIEDRGLNVNDAGSTWRDTLVIPIESTPGKFSLMISHDETQDSQKGSRKQLDLHCPSFWSNFTICPWSYFILDKSSGFYFRMAIHSRFFTLVSRCLNLLAVEFDEHIILQLS